jgi:hypothetical protein
MFYRDMKKKGQPLGGLQQPTDVKETRLKETTSQEFHVQQSESQKNLQNIHGIC